MRSLQDRIRHALSFEIIGLLLVIPLGALLFGMPMEDIGVVGLVSATLATIWNYVYNLGFDHAMQRLKGTTLKTPAIRVGHAVLFELGLLIVLMPFIAWYLNISLAHALVMDISFALFTWSMLLSSTGATTASSPCRNGSRSRTPPETIGKIPIASVPAPRLHGPTFRETSASRPQSHASRRQRPGRVLSRNWRCLSR